MTPKLTAEQTAELQRIAESRANDNVASNGAAAPEPNGSSPAGEGLRLTDAGNARRLVSQYGREIRFAPGLGWHVWDRRRWAPDLTGAVMRCAKATARGIYGEAASEPDDDRRKRIAAWAAKSESEPRLRAMISLGESERELVLPPATLDDARGLLNVANGVIDMRTGKLGAHRPDLYITHLARAEYDPVARCATWERVIGRACGGDDELARFVQRAVGYSATGEACEDKLLFVHGSGATSKTTVIGAVQHALGDYCAVADFESFLRRRGDAPIRTDIARLAGKRLVVSLEVDEGRRLAEGLVKNLTGGDKVTARFLYAREFEFRPAFVLWLVANARPRASSSDDALWRRIVQVPFVNVIPESERDPSLRRALQSAESSRAVLAWIVRGAIDYYANGLDVPETVLDYTAQYRAENDDLGDFLEDRCALEPDAWAIAADLRAAYEHWCERNGETPVSARALGAALKEHNCTRDRLPQGGRARIWRGITIRGEAA